MRAEISAVASAERQGPIAPRWLGLAFRIAERLEVGALTIELPDGSRRVFRGRANGPSGHLRVNRARAVRRLAFGGSLGLAEAYLDGDWDSPDLARVLELLALNEAAWRKLHYGRRGYTWLARLQHLLRPNTRRGSRRNILAHYDLGNRFFELWLDRSMTYSAARYPRADLTLEEAQQAKYEALAERLDLRPEHHLLEIGCGWGGFARFAAGEVGARVTAVTISDEQRALASERIRAAGLAERVEVRLQDYRDVSGRFDRIASIEMFEAVGERYWPLFFARLRELLAPGGRAALQVITIADQHFDAYRRSVDFIRRHVFPGGMLPSPGALSTEIERVGFRKAGETTFGMDYARTLATWSERFHAAWPEIRPLGFDQRFRRLWEYYLAYCEAGFRVGFTDVCQIVLRPA